MTPVRFENVSKLFRQHHANAPDGDLWALKDVSFACEEGEAVGLIGRNGCGKSTLLKLAAGVTSPTIGTVDCAKPIAPMLELGAGFHPDLTGRDNIKFNGCLLGLGWRMQRSLLDEIVAFAELEQHVDTPVKHYSSGMYARLGFAVAVHSPARVLLVDEVLSVGDRMFQQKCYFRMKHLRDSGTTILLVSHDSWWIRNFCNRAIVIDSGRVIADSQPENALQVYEGRLRGVAGSSGPGVEVLSVTLIDEDRPDIRSFPQGTRLVVRIVYDASGAPEKWLFAVRIRREDGLCCATCIVEGPTSGGNGFAVAEIEDLHLMVSQYTVEVSIEDGATLKTLATQISPPFVVCGDFDFRRGYDGVMKLRHAWSFA